MNTEALDVCENVKKIKQRIAAAAQRSGRNPEDILFVAVTKTVEPSRIAPAIAEGITTLGENRVQELCEKYDILDKSVAWHLIGHLQTNKVKYIMDKVSLIHSLDRMELALEIDKRAAKAGRVMDVLVQVNIAEEDSKFGIHKDMAVDFIKKVSDLKNMKVRGLMTIGPLTQNPEEIRWVFRELSKLRIDINRENIDNINMDYLSMGMSNDFEIAIEEGANIVRIGSALFGHRQYVK